MFKAVFYKICHGSSYNETPEQFFRYVELPFSPFVGLEVRGEFGTVGPVLSVKYDLESNVLWCTTEPDERLLQYEKNDTPESERLRPEQVYEFLELQGWERFDKNDRPWFWLGTKIDQLHREST